MIARTCSILAVFLTLTGCETVQYKTVEVPIRVACITSVPAKPSRLTPCLESITDSQCVKRSAIDVERLQSAVDQLTSDLEACR